MVGLQVNHLPQEAYHHCKREFTDVMNNSCDISQFIFSQFNVNSTVKKKEENTEKETGSYFGMEGSALSPSRGQKHIE